MKATCLQEEFSKGLSVVGRAIASRTTLPITNNVLLATDQGRLKLVATNLEMALSYWLGAKVETEGAITVPWKLISEWVNTLDKYSVSIELIKKTLELRCGRYDARIAGVDAKDFPPIPIVGGDTIEVKADSLRQALNQVCFAAAAADTSRPVLTGVLALFDANTLTFASADGFRLAIYKMALDTQIAQKTEVVIPAKTLNELIKLITEEDETIKINLNPPNSQMLFQMKKCELVTQLIQGSFPRYNELIPKEHTSRAVMNTAALLRALKTSMVFAHEDSGLIRLVGAGDKLTISAQSREIGDNIGEIDAKMEGIDFKIAFNGRYIIEVLNELKEEQVALEVSGSSTPGVIRPVGSDSYTYVAMPVFAQW